MTIRAYAADDQQHLVQLWQNAGLLTNPLNDPVKDIALCLDSEHGAILVGTIDGILVASVMVGHDGHRGWIYYLAVAPERRNRHLGQQLTFAAEDWLKNLGIPKVQLMIRETNLQAIGFYQRIGYACETVSTMSKRLDQQPPPAALKTMPEKVVITYLEMTEPPVLKAMAPPLQPLSLLHAKPPTVGFYRYLYDAVGRDWFWTDLKALTDRQLEEIILDSNVDIYVLYACGVPAGFFQLDRRNKGVINLAYFGIVAGFTGKRLGPYLLSAALKTAWGHKPERVTLNTCTLDHPKALPLYQRFGFVAIDRREVLGFQAADEG